MLLPADLCDALVDIARSDLPNEVCGYVAGRAGVTPVAQALYEVRNSDRSPTSFALDGQSMIDAESQIDDAGLEIVGVFHSHPDGAPVPSVKDRRDASVYDPAGHLVHVIVSLLGTAPEIRAWSYDDDGAVELALIDGLDT